jgi:hypothetical protein
MFAGNPLGMRMRPRDQESRFPGSSLARLGHRQRLPWWSLRRRRWNTVPGRLRQVNAAYQPNELTRTTNHHQ